MKSVYRMTAADGRVLYVGCTGNLPLRIDRHRQTKPWWTEVATITVEHFDDPEQAIAAEYQAISETNPTFNRIRDIDRDPYLRKMRKQGRAA